MPSLRPSLARLQLKAAGWRANWRTLRLNRRVSGKARPNPGQPPVVFFNASTRLVGISLNAGFAYIAASGLQLAGVPVIYFGCNAGMSRCVLGTDRDNHTKPPPCRGCTAQAQWLFAHAPAVWFSYEEDAQLARAVGELTLAELSCFEYPLQPSEPSQRGAAWAVGFDPIPLGKLVLPSLRWALRRHDLQDDEATRFIFREYLLSAYRVANEFDACLQRVEPVCVVTFNGTMYPEAVASWVARQHGIRVVTHEVGFLPFSAFFTDGQATAYPIDIPAEFELSQEQNVRLDAYLDQRFNGEFTMAGIRFWPEIRALDTVFEERLGQFQQLVPVFTNVVFDTSQVHANTVFAHMYAWLELVAGIIRDHPETLFVIRAHLDEMRPGKESRQSVKEWFEGERLGGLPNVLFVEPEEYLSSYELIEKAKFVMVYNSSIGLEAALMGAAVLCGGRARYTRYPIVFFPNTPGDYRREAEAFLAQADPIQVPAEFRRNARRFMYYQLFRASLPFDDFLEPFPQPGFVQLRPISWRQLMPERSETMRVLVEGLLHGKPFLMEEQQLDRKD